MYVCIYVCILYVCISLCTYVLPIYPQLPSAKICDAEKPVARLGMTTHPRPGLEAMVSSIVLVIAVYI